MGRIAGPFQSHPMPDMVFSPLGLVPKKGSSEFRLIHDLSFPLLNSVNSHIPVERSTVVFEDLDHCLSIIRRLGRGTLVAKADLQDAFRIIPIAPQDHRLLGFRFQGAYYYDRCLPMGCSVSCQTFEALSTALQWICTEKFGVSAMSHILDDFIFFGPHGVPNCQNNLDIFLSLCDKLSLPIKQAKTVQPATSVSLHGILVNTQDMSISLPEDKQRDLTQRLKALHKRKSATLREIQSLNGSINFACKVVVPGRAFARRLIDLTLGKSKPSHHIRITAEARKDMQAWLLFMQSFNGRSFILPDSWLSSDVVRLTTDACGMGYGAVLGDSWLQGRFHSSWKDKHISPKEFLPIILALRAWHPVLANKRILFLSDNSTVVAAINNQTSKDHDIMSLLRQFVVLCMQYNILFKGKHIPGKINTVADAISRFQIEKAREVRPTLQQLPVGIDSAWLPW